MQLLTLRAREALERAEVIVYDFLANERLLALAPKAERIYVGKQGGNHTMSQHDINALLVREVAGGKRVVRLKGGDPFLFGRGGEEGKALADAGLPFEVVPGITSALAVPAYAGIPVTERSSSASLAIVTGHENPHKDRSGVDFGALVNMGTIVILMGMSRIAENMRGLLDAGMEPDRPAAAIQWGTRYEQRTVVGTVSDLAARVAEAKLGAPAIIVVGEVVRMRESLNWFEGRPWFGKRIVVTRSREANAAVVDELEHRGAEVVQIPTISFTEPADFASLDEGIAGLGDYDWVVFTSANGVQAFRRRLLHQGLDARALAGCRIAAVGPATAAALEEFGLVADLIPPRFEAEALAPALGDELARSRILLVRAEKGREEFIEAARAAGARVDLAVAYRTVPAARPPEFERVLAAERIPELIMFASPSAVHAFLGMLEGDERERLRGASAACIGPVTARAAREGGFEVAVVPRDFTLPGLLEAMDDYFRGSKHVSD